LNADARIAVFPSSEGLPGSGLAMLPARVPSHAKDCDVVLFKAQLPLNVTSCPYQVQWCRLLMNKAG